jgi:hypothetical protein
VVGAAAAYRMKFLQRLPDFTRLLADLGRVADEHRNRLPIDLGPSFTRIAEFAAPVPVGAQYVLSLYGYGKNGLPHKPVF